MCAPRRDVLCALATTLSGGVAGCTTGSSHESSTPDEGAGRTTTAETTDGATTGTTDRATTASNTSSEGTTDESSTAGATSSPSVDVEPQETTVELGGYETMVRLDVIVDGGVLADASWGAIEMPDGSSVGILDYDEYARVHVDEPGEYAIQVTATFDSGGRDRDVATIHVTESTTTTTEDST